MATVLHALSCQSEVLSILVFFWTRGAAEMDAKTWEPSYTELYRLVERQARSGGIGADQHSRRLREDG